MKVIGKMIKLMGMENILKKMAQFLKELGKMINNMVKVLRYGEKQPNMKAIMTKEKNMEKEPLLFRTAVFTKENLKIILLMDMGHLNGKMVKSILENGSIIKCKGRVN